MKIAIVAILVGAAHAMLKNDVTGPTPPPISCENTLCNGKYDGNYEIDGEPNYFVQCVSGVAYCQACWPVHLYFSKTCNQCVYNKEDPCSTTQEWTPAVTHYCPDMCTGKGPDYEGNVKDPDNASHYVACWKGVTVGCITCPGKLLYNEEYNACLYEGKYYTESDKYKETK